MSIERTCKNCMQRIPDKCSRCCDHEEWEPAMQTETAVMASLRNLLQEAMAEARRLFDARLAAEKAHAQAAATVDRIQAAIDALATEVET